MPSNLFFTMIYPPGGDAYIPSDSPFSNLVGLNECCPILSEKLNNYFECTDHDLSPKIQLGIFLRETPYLSPSFEFQKQSKFELLVLITNYLLFNFHDQKSAMFRYRMLADLLNVSPVNEANYPEYLQIFCKAWIYDLQSHKGLAAKGWIEKILENVIYVVQYRLGDHIILHRREPDLDEIKNLLARTRAPVDLLGKPALQIAIERKNGPLVCLLLAQTNINALVKCGDPTRGTALFQAIQNGSWRILFDLIEKREDVFLDTNFNPDTPAAWSPVQVAYERFWSKRTGNYAKVFILVLLKSLSLSPSSDIIVILTHIVQSLIKDPGMNEPESYISYPFNRLECLQLLIKFYLVKPEELNEIDGPLDLAKQANNDALVQLLETSPVKWTPVFLQAKRVEIASTGPSSSNGFRG